MDEYLNASNAQQIWGAVKEEISNDPQKVRSFNGRAGNVKPEKGDYTAEMVGAIASDVVKKVEFLNNEEEYEASDKDPNTWYLIWEELP